MFYRWFQALLPKVKVRFEHVQAHPLVLFQQWDFRIGADSSLGIWASHCMGQVSENTVAFSI